MLKRTLAILAGVVLLATAATDAKAAGLTLDAGLQAEVDPFLTISPLETLTLPSGVEVGGVVSNFGGFLFVNSSTTDDLVNITEAIDVLTLTSSFSLEVTDSTGGVSKLTGSDEDLIFMENTSGDDLIEILFSTSGSLTSAPFVLASITGEFGSDPLNTTQFASTLFPAGAAAGLTLTAVNQVPLPAGLVLLLSALGGLVLVRRRAA